MKLAGVTAACLSATLLAGCGEVSRSGQTPAQLMIVALEGASGAEPDEFSNTVHSDVVTIVESQQAGATVRIPTKFSDGARATMRLVLRDPGVPGVAATPSALNAITINRYRVAYRRADGRNQPGVDVPFPFDSAVTFTVSGTDDVTVGFVLVRHTAKDEQPLATLVSNPVIISTIADVSFYGRDQAGNEVSVTGSIGIFFGNFGDPQ